MPSEQYLSTTQHNMIPTRQVTEIPDSGVSAAILNITDFS